MLTGHCLPARDFDALAEGLGSAATVATLRQTQLSKRLLVLRAVLDAADRSGYKSHLPGFDLLCDVQQHDAITANAVLGYPFVGSWAARCLRDGPAEAELMHLNGVAAAAAIAAGMPFSIDVPVRDGAIYLPSLGRLMTTDRPVMTVHGDGSGEPLAGKVGWQPVHRISASADGQTLSVILDDVDPFRGGPQLPVAPRLDDTAVCAWEHSLRQAWDILVRDHSDYADAIGAGLAAIVPMIDAAPNRGVNATSRESFGAAAISAVSDPVVLAAGVLHEFQHCKLNAVLDFANLYESDDRRYYAPWRQDPRPIGGLLHGAYAFLGVCDFWRVRPYSSYAQLEYARWSERTGIVLNSLLGSGRLTTLGERFTRRMRDRLRGWPTVIPEEPGRLARTASADHRLAWRLRNMRPKAVIVDSLVRAWQSGAPASGRTEPAEVVAGGTALGTSSRLDLLYLRLRDPQGFARLAQGTGTGTGTERADAQLLSGHVTRAADGYLERIRTEPRSMDAWSGLALALGENATSLLHAPELVRAVYNRLVETGSPAPDPRLLAEWLKPVVTADPFQISDPVYPSRTR